MPQPGMTSARGEDWLVREIQDLKQRLQQLAAANVFGLTGITPEDGGTSFDGYVNVNGPMTVSGDTNFTGNTTIGGNANITGNITQSNIWGGSSLGQVVFGTGGPALTFTKNGTTYGQPVGIGLTRNGSDTADQVTINGPETSDPAYIVLRSDKSFALASDSSNVGPEVYSTAGSNGITYLLGGQTNGGVSIQAYGTGKCQVYGNFAVTGTKAFIMDHPVNPDAMELMHAATESPVNGVEYWGTVTLDSTGQAVATLPSYFEALTKATGRNIQLTPIGRTTVQVSADRIVGGAFTIYGAPGQEVDWLVKAARQKVVDGYDELSFPVELDKVLIGPQFPAGTPEATP